MRFNSTIEPVGRKATGIRVPGEVLEVLGRSREAKVQVKLGRYSYRSTVARRAGEFEIPLTAADRRAAGVATGDEVVVELALDAAFSRARRRR